MSSVYWTWLTVYTLQIKLGEGIEIYEDQLRSVKWNDYRKLTRGLATILFSPAELATCSVTGQRWSRAGSGERPVKPALDRAKVQAIICKFVRYKYTDFDQLILEQFCFIKKCTSLQRNFCCGMFVRLNLFCVVLTYVSFLNLIYFKLN